MPSKKNINCKNAEDVIRTVKAKKIEFIQFWFTDILGTLKSFTVTPSELKNGLKEGMGFDGSSVEGFARIHESDMIAKPDPTTFQLISWGNNERPIARIFCDIENPDGTPYEGDPRYVLKKMVAGLEKKGLIAYMGPEVEYYYFKDKNGTEVLDNGGYFDSKFGLGERVRRETMKALQNIGIIVEYAHHECGNSMHEIDLRYDEALSMADKTMTHKIVVKEIAQDNGIYATFMPKPMFGEPGNGMHVHQSLFKGTKNVFYDANDKYNLSGDAKHYIAGLIKHAREIAVVTNQWVNSYKRLVPGYEAPVYISWARRNRSAMIRIPMYKPGKEIATRVELRMPDSACNPYLAFAMMIGAGLKGIKEKYELGDPTEEDIYEMNPAERKKHGITDLPDNLHSAIKEFEKSELAREVLGDHIFNKFIKNKRMEWEDYKTHVGQFETDRYLDL